MGTEPQREVVPCTLCLLQAGESRLGAVLDKPAHASQLTSADANLLKGDFSLKAPAEVRGSLKVFNYRLEGSAISYFSIGKVGNLLTVQCNV